MSAPRIPRSEKYWKNKGIKPKRVMRNGKRITTYKNVMLYTHDDLDGIYSAILIKNILLQRGYNIIGYGIVNYQEGWKFTTLNEDVINVAVDYAGFHERIDIYVDHHGSEIGEDNVVHKEKEKDKSIHRPDKNKRHVINKDYAIKIGTCSAFEAVGLQYNIPHDSLTLHPIDMVDSAKYIHYDVEFSSVIKFNWENILNSKNKKLTFTGMINQFIKRGDHHTLIEVIHNCDSPSIYKIYLKLKEFYSGNNHELSNIKVLMRAKAMKPNMKIKLDKIRKCFIKDGMWRINEMIERTRQIPSIKTVYTDQKDFINDCFNKESNRIDLLGRGYQVFGNLAFIPSGTWCNAIRARAIIEEDIKSGYLPSGVVEYILLQYGNTLQMVAYENIKQIPKEKSPVLKNGDVLTEIGIGKYMSNLLYNFKEHLDYTDPSTYISTIEDEITVGGGHFGIGTLSNVCGRCYKGTFSGVKYIDIFKNKIIQDISTCKWDKLNLVWTEERDIPRKDPEMDSKVMLIKDIRSSGDKKSHKEKKLGF